MAKIIKVGPKERHIEIPDGFDVVTEGTCQDGDYFAQAYELQKGTAKWISAGDCEIGDPFDMFDLLIHPKYPGLKPFKR